MQQTLDLKKILRLIAETSMPVRPEPNSILSKFASSMKQKGLKEIGAGAMALVFQSEKTDEVVKVFRRDECYVKFLKLIADNPNNIHLPKIHQYENLKTPPYNGLHIVKMEKLQAVHEDKNFQDVCFKMYSALRELEHDKGATSQSAQYAVNKLKESVAKLDKSNQDLVDTVSLIANVPAKCGADLHDQNVMKRADGTLVIIDPYI